MKLTPSEKRLIKRFEKKFVNDFGEIIDGSATDIEALKVYLIKEVRRAEKRGFKEGNKWIQSREFKALTEMMGPPVKTRNLNGECPKCGGASDGNVYMSNPPQKKCSICGNFWSYWVSAVEKL